MLIEKIKSLRLDREKRSLLNNVFACYAIKGASMLLALFTTPAYIRYFKNDAVLGVWFTILSILTWILNFDMGIGNGLRNKLVITLGAEKIDESRKYISSTYIFLIVSAIVIAVAGSGLIQLLNWNKILGISSGILDEDQLIRAVRIVFYSIIAQFVLRNIVSIAYALQKAYVSGLLTLCTNVGMLIYTLLSNYTGNNGSIIHLAWVYLLAANVPLVITNVLLFSRSLRELKPALKWFSLFHAKDTLQLGSMFMYLQLLALLMSNTSNILISNLLGAEQVVEFQLHNKLFSFVSNTILMCLIPMWSAITKAYAEKRFKWLTQAIGSMYLLIALVLVSETVLAFMLPLVFRVWLGAGAPVINRIAVVCFVINAVFYAWSQICCFISNGIGKLTVQMLANTFGVIISFAFSTILAKIWKSYLAVLLGMTLGYMPVCFAQTIWTLNFCKMLKAGVNDEFSVLDTKRV